MLHRTLRRTNTVIKTQTQVCSHWCVMGVVSRLRNTRCSVAGTAGPLTCAVESFRCVRGCFDVRSQMGPDVSRKTVRRRLSVRCVTSDIPEKQPWTSRRAHCRASHVLHRELSGDTKARRLQCRYSGAAHCWRTSQSVTETKNQEPCVVYCFITITHKLRSERW